MLKSTAYHFLVKLLSLTILLGVTIPSGLHAMSEGKCSAMMQHSVPLSGHEDCPETVKKMPAHSGDHKAVSAHGFGFACTCSIDQAPVTTESTVIQKLKISLSILSLNSGTVLPDLQKRRAQIFSDMYDISTPPLYLLNASFLN